MNEEKKLSKIKKIASATHKVLQIILWILVIASGLLILAEVVVYTLSDQYFIVKDLYNGFMNIKVEGWFTYDLVGEVGQEISFKSLALMTIPGVLLSVLFYIINIQQIKKILRSIMDDKAFDIKNAKCLSIMGINFLSASILFQLAGNIFGAELFKLIGIDAGSISFLPDFSLLFTGVLLLILSSVFKYGNYLQEEYDETV